jgi:molybdopterin synthase sulfur carrier subunit
MREEENSMIQVNLIATFKMIAGKNGLTLDLPEGKTVKDAVTAVLLKVPALRPHWLNDQGEIHAHVHIYLNGDDVNTLLDGMETVLKNNDELDFIPPVAGG